MPGPFQIGPGLPVKFPPTKQGDTGASADASAVYVPVGLLASKRYPRIMHPNKWCMNGMIPDAYFWRQAVDAANHVLAYRPKMFMSIGDMDNRVSSAAGTVNAYRFQCSTGWGTKSIRFDLTMGQDNVKPNGSNPNAVIDVVNVNGTVVGTSTIYYGANIDADQTTDALNEYGEFSVDIDVNPGTTYTVVVNAVGSGRILALAAYEIHHDTVDPVVNYFVRQATSVFTPIFDANREIVLRSLSEVYRFNGAHLMTYPGDGTGAAVSTTGTTWTNFIDGATAYADDSAGFDFDPTSLVVSCRLKDVNVLPVTFAVYGNVTAGVSLGEVRLQDSLGTACSLATIDTALGWYSVDTTIDLTTRNNKIDLQFRNKAAGTTNIYAVCLYSMAA